MRLSAAILSGVSAIVITVIPLAWLGNGLLGWHGWVTHLALVAGILIALASWRLTPPSSCPVPRSLWEWLRIGFFSCASARAFLWLIYADGDSWKILSPNNLGDLALHFSFINWLAVTPHWWPASPILAGDPLRYPPGCDLFNSVLLVTGAPVIEGLLWCGLAGAALSTYALWRWGGAIALAALLFNGGFAGLLLFQKGWGADLDGSVEWKNLFLTLFVTQRSFLFALPAGLLLLVAWKEESFGIKKKVILPLPVQGLLLGVMPLFSIHSALYLGTAMSGLAIFAPATRERMWKLAVISWPPMVLFAWMVTSGAGGPSAVKALGWHFGWTSDGSIGFWFWNFGIVLPLGALLCIRLMIPDPKFETREIEARAFVWPAVGVFLVCLLVRFAPWAWDNMKLMIWSWIVVAPFLWNILLKMRPLWIRVPTVLLLFGTGFVSLLSGLDGRHGYELIKRSSLDEAAWILRGIPPTSILACAPEYNQPVLMLGHPVLCGYEGHLWSHGLDYKGRLDALNSFMMGEDGWEEKARRLGVSYIYWGDLEAKRWPDSKFPWAKDTNIPSVHALAR